VRLFISGGREPLRLLKDKPKKTRDSRCPISRGTDPDKLFSAILRKDKFLKFSIEEGIKSVRLFLSR
jgi:hypothetical protein